MYILDLDLVAIFSFFIENAIKYIEINNTYNNRNMEKTHNLDIYTYSLPELLGLLDLPTSNITDDDMKRAKHRVLMTHPDKSNLEPKYFQFYKQAYDLALAYHREHNKQNMVVKNTEYVPFYSGDVDDASENKEIRKIINKSMNANPTKFQENFNELYENTYGMNKKTINNDWFYSEQARKEETAPELFTPVKKGNITKKDIDSEFAEYKRRMQSQQQTSITIHRGVQSIASSASVGFTSAYEDDVDIYQNNYISCDPFSKLQYEDLRKVHKDQTIFSVGEHDFKDGPSLEDYKKECKKNILAMKREEAERILDEQEIQKTKEFSEKLHNSTIDGMKNKIKQKTILAQFLQLT